MEIRETALAGCYTVHPAVRPDERGVFVKTYLGSAFAAAGLPTGFPEQFFSRSRQGVVRGLHVQFAPADQAKLVHCVSGAVFDVAVDVRVGSPTYGEHVACTLTDEDWTALYVPVGFAHGFAVLSGTATVGYLATAEYAPGTDGGVRWDSAGIDWPVAEPVLSPRDAALPPLAEFESPFPL
jgi:dTDP-4-dehydrorhamnose 3,5-epimerase